MKRSSAKTHFWKKKAIFTFTIFTLKSC